MKVLAWLKRSYLELIILIIIVAFVIATSLGIEFFDLHHWIGIEACIDEQSLSNYIELVVLHFSIVFLTTSLMATLGEKDEVVYYKDIVKEKLLKPNGRSFYDLSTYAFATLVLSVSGLFFHKSYIVLLSALVGMIILVCIFYKMISIYFRRDEIKQRIEQSLYVEDKKKYEIQLRKLAEITEQNIEENDYEHAFENFRLICLCVFIDGLKERDLPKSDQKVPKSFYFHIYERLKIVLENKDSCRFFDFLIRCVHADYSKEVRVVRNNAVTEESIRRCFSNVIDSLCKKNVRDRLNDVNGFSEYYYELKEKVSSLLNQNNPQKDELKKELGRLVSYALFANDRRNLLMGDMVGFLVESEYDVFDKALASAYINEDNYFASFVGSFLDDKSYREDENYQYYDHKYECRGLYMIPGLLYREHNKEFDKVFTLFSRVFWQKMSTMIEDAKKEKKSEEKLTFKSSYPIELYLYGYIELVSSRPYDEKLTKNLVEIIDKYYTAYNYLIIDDKESTDNRTVRVPNAILLNADVLFVRIINVCINSYNESGLFPIAKGILTFLREWLSVRKPMMIEKRDKVRTIVENVYLDDDFEDDYELEIPEEYEEELKEYYEEQAEEEKYKDDLWDRMCDEGRLHIPDYIQKDNGSLNTSVGNFFNDEQKEYLRSCRSLFINAFRDVFVDFENFYPNDSAFEDLVSLINDYSKIYDY